MAGFTKPLDYGPDAIILKGLDGNSHAVATLR